MSDVKLIFGRNLQKYRKMRSLSQEQLAERLGVSSRHLCYIETGRAFVSAELLQKISSSLGVAFSALFYDDGSRLIDESAAGKIGAAVDEAAKSLKCKIAELCNAV